MESAFMQVRIKCKDVEATDIVVLELAPMEGETLPVFSAGSHIDLEIRPGLVRQYSLCNDSSERHRYVIGVLRDPKSRGGSIAVHDALTEGQVIRISPPRNHFALAPAPRSLLFAGGIGVTPILCMAERLALIDADFEMHYCARSAAHMAFRSRIGCASFAGKVHLHFDDGAAEQRLDLPAVLGRADADTHLYVCGPGGFIDYVNASARAAGWNGGNIHFEYFAGQASDPSTAGSFEIKLASSGKVFTVPADKSVVAVLAAQGIEIPTSCQQGVCGTCTTRVLEGEIDHRDKFFTDEEKALNDQFMPCCSRAKSARLVLDI